MSLQKPNGEIITVEGVSTNKVEIRVCENSAQRARFKVGTMSSFETTHGETRSILVDLSAIPDATKSIKDNQITAGYEALKTLPEFVDALDV